MSGTIVRPFETKDGNVVQQRLRSAWRLEIPKQFNLTQVIAEQPLGHVIVAVCVAVIYLITGGIGMLSLALPMFYIALYFIVLIFFLLQSDKVLLGELADIPANYQSNSSSQFWVVETTNENKEIVGTVGLLKKTEDLAQIRHLLVNIDQQNKSEIIRRLLLTTLQFAKIQNYSEVDLIISAVTEDIATIFDNIGLKLKETFFMPSKHLYILPMQVLHVKVDEVNFDQISEDNKTTKID